MALLIGPESWKTLARFNQQLQSIALSDTNADLRTHYSNYQPWMSHEGERIRLSKLHSSMIWDGEPPMVMEGKSLLDFSLALGSENLRRLDSKALSFSLAGAKDDNTMILTGLIREVLGFIKNHSPRFWRKIECTVSHIIPITSSDPKTIPTRRDGSGFSNHHVRGAVFLSLPMNSDTSRFELALNLVHECGHQALMIYQCSDDILLEDLRTPVYSIIRKTERPAILSFHAAIATAFMLEWLSEAMHSISHLVPEELALLRFQMLKQDLELSLSSFVGRRFTPFGQIMLEELRSLAQRATIQIENAHESAR